MSEQPKFPLPYRVSPGLAVKRARWDHRSVERNDGTTDIQRFSYGDFRWHTLAKTKRARVKGVAGDLPDYGQTKSVLMLEYALALTGKSGAEVRQVVTSFLERRLSGEKGIYWHNLVQ